MMAEEILVPMKKINRVKDITSYLEKIPKQAMRIIFLIPIRTELFPCLLHDWITAESREEALLAGKEIVEWYSLETKRRSTEQNGLSNDETLQRTDSWHVRRDNYCPTESVCGVSRGEMAMEPTGLERKLTAILSADVEGYSRLMGEDEAGTIRTLTTYREAITTLIQQHRGRVVDSPGDNLLAEFASAVDAVEVAIDIQRELKTRNAELPADRQMVYRIGINVGEVVVEGERIYGDGVNITARLESMAEAGGICISRSAFELVRDKLAVGFKNLGDQKVKNINRPISAYSVLTAPQLTGTVISTPAKRLARWKWPAVTTTLVFILIAASIGVWWQ